MATAFHFRVVDSDGELRTSTLQELRRQGLIPVYEQQARGFELNEDASKIIAFIRSLREDGWLKEEF